MKKLLFLFAIILGHSIVSFGQEDIFAVVENDTVTIWHVETERNCASAYKMEFDIIGNDINLYQIDTVGPIVYCVCSFDLSATLTNLTPGIYNVDVYSLYDGFSANDTTFWGSTSFLISSGDGIPQLLTNTQSPCYDPTSIENQHSNNIIKLFPNPAEEHIYVETGTDNYQVQIKNILGQVIIEEESFEKKIKIDLTEIQPGVYFISISSSETEIIRKIVKR